MEMAAYITGEAALLYTIFKPSEFELLLSVEDIKTTSI